MVTEFINAIVSTITSFLSGIGSGIVDFFSSLFTDGDGGISTFGLFGAIILGLGFVTTLVWTLMRKI